MSDGPVTETDDVMAMPDTVEILATWADTALSDTARMVDMAVGVAMMQCGATSVVLGADQVGALFSQYRIERETLSSGWRVKLVPLAEANQGKLDLDDI